MHVHAHVHVHVHAHVLWPYRLGPRRCEHDRLTRRRVRRQCLDDELELRSVGRERAGQKKELKLYKVSTPTGASERYA